MGRSARAALRSNGGHRQMVRDCAKRAGEEQREARQNRWISGEGHWIFQGGFTVGRIEGPSSGSRLGFPPLFGAISPLGLGLRVKRKMKSMGLQRGLFPCRGGCCWLRKRNRWATLGAPGFLVGIRWRRRESFPPWQGVRDTGTSPSFATLLFQVRTEQVVTCSTVQHTPDSLAMCLHFHAAAGPMKPCGRPKHKIIISAWPVGPTMLPLA
jgi:hypothetical protein